MRARSAPSGLPRAVGVTLPYPAPLGAFYGLWPYKHFFRSQAARIFEGMHVPQAPRAGSIELGEKSR